MSKKKIILIDDDKAAHEFYIMVLKASFPDNEVKFYQYPEEFDSDNIYSDTVIVVLDIMFAGNGPIKGGFDYGIKWYETFKQMHPKIPVIILTNLPSSNTDEFMESIISNKDILIKKPSITPNELAAIVEEIISRDEN